MNYFYLLLPGMPCAYIKGVNCYHIHGLKVHNVFLLHIELSDTVFWLQILTVLAPLAPHFAVLFQVRPKIMTFCLMIHFCEPTMVRSMKSV